MDLYNPVGKSNRKVKEMNTRNQKLLKGVYDCNKDVMISPVKCGSYKKFIKEVIQYE